MSFLRLLELWAEMEPDRCSYASGIVVLRGWTLAYDSDLTDRLTLAEIQSALQEAIEDRSWNWYLGRVIIDKEVFYKAVISIPAEDPEYIQGVNKFISAHSPAYALLEAYLHKLLLISKEMNEGFDILG